MEVNLMGYADPAQVAGGIHQRLFARAFVFDDGIKKFAYVSADIGMGSDLLNQKVVERLEDLVGPGVYGYENLVVSGTHTHSSPAGYLQYVLFQATSWGFMNQTFSAYVEGVAEAVVAAHNDLQPASATLVQGELEGANINRSPTSYLLNPDASDYDADTDLNMLLLSVTAQDSGEPLGVLNWFAVRLIALRVRFFFEREQTNRLTRCERLGLDETYGQLNQLS
jgi:neutral ceramidase